jgi:hypothetical protein
VQPAQKAKETIKMMLFGQKEKKEINRSWG